MASKSRNRGKSKTNRRRRNRTVRRRKIMRGGVNIKTAYFTPYVDKEAFTRDPLYFRLTVGGKYKFQLNDDKVLIDDKHGRTIGWFTPPQNFEDGNYRITWVQVDGGFGYFGANQVQ